MSRPLILALKRLLEAEQRQLGSSELTPSQRRALEEFAARTGSVRQQRQGRGRIYRVISPAIVEQHLQALAPGLRESLDPDLPRRSRNIARYRDSKSGRHQHDSSYLLLKGTPGARWQRCDGARFDLAAETASRGASVLALGPELQDDWTSDGELWLLENQEVFDRLDWLPAGTRASLVWYRGQLENNLIEWLAQRPRASRLVLFPDYDGVGLDNYLRLRRRLGSQVAFWLMPDWEQKLIRYGDNALWNRTAADFRTAVEQLEQQGEPLDPALHQLIGCMSRYGLALEQEAVFLPSSHARRSIDSGS